MRMQGGPFLMLGLALGLGVGLVSGWLGRDLLQPESAPLTSFAEMQRARARAEQEAPLLAQAPGGPVMSGGGAPPATTYAGASQAAEEAAVAEPVHELDVIATLSALVGSDADFLRMADLALQNGIDPDRLLDAIRLAPLARRAALLDALRAQHPDAPFDDVQIAYLYRGAGAPEKALELVQHLLPTVSEFSPKLVALLIDLDPEHAAARLLELPASAAWSAEALLTLQMRFDHAGQSGAVLPFLLRRLAAVPSDDAVLGMLVEVDAGKALEVLGLRLAETPDVVALHAWKGRACGLTGDIDGAFASYREAYRLEPNSTWMDALADLDLGRAIPLLVEMSRDALNDEIIGALGRAYEAAGERDKAITTFLRALEREPGDGEWSDALIRLDPQRALGVLREALREGSVEENEEQDELIGDYADALLAMGRRAAAFDEYARAFAGDTDDWEWKNAMVKVDPARAIEVLGAHLKNEPTDDVSHAAVARAYATLGRREEAVHAIEEALRIRSSPDHHLQLAELDAARAIRRVKSALLSRPEDDQLWGTLGRIYRQTGHEDEARSAFERAASLDPADSEWVEALAEKR